MQEALKEIIKHSIVTFIDVAEQTPENDNKIEDGEEFVKSCINLAFKKPVKLGKRTF